MAKNIILAYLFVIQFIEYLLMVTDQQNIPISAAAIWNSNELFLTISSTNIFSKFTTNVKFMTQQNLSNERLGTRDAEILAS